MANNKEHKLLNQFGDYEDVTNMSVEDWVYRWGVDHTKFHSPSVHPVLLKYLNTLTNGKPKCKVFLPLCGKSLDIKWLLDQGHEVVGCDCADKAFEEFFTENDIAYSTHNMSKYDGTVYKARDLPLTLYRCDFFKLSRSELGQFDCIWDRGSYVAIPVSQRPQYRDVILPLLKTSGRYFLDTFLLEHDKFAGPPYNCDEVDVKKNFGSNRKVEKLEVWDRFGDWQKSWGVTFFLEELFMIS